MTGAGTKPGFSSSATSSLVALLFLLLTAAPGLAGNWTDWYLHGAILEQGEVLTLAAPPDGQPVAAWQQWPDVNLKRHSLSLALLAAEWAAVEAVEVVLSADGNFAEYFSVDLVPLLVTPPAGTWLQVPVPAGAWHASPGARWDSINAALLRVTARPGSTALVQLQGLQHHRQPGSPGFVTLAFDDGWADAHEVAFPLLEKAGMRATAYVIPRLLGSDRYLTQGQVDELHAAGWDIAGHGAEALTSLSAAALDEELRSTSSWLQERGYRGAEHYAYPNGAFSQQVLQATGRYFATGRTINPVSQAPAAASALQLGAVSVYPAFGQDTLQALITSAVTSGEWLQITFHRLAGEPELTTEFSVQRFSETVDFLVEHGVTVLTVTEAWERLSGLVDSGKPDCPPLSDAGPACY
jgi:peptidoglycan/xylan/chitin deacetylase (PgdA/CDA1 family)